LESKNLTHFKFLCVELLDTHRTTIAVVHLNEHLPFGRRVVQIELTQEQQDKISPKELGTNQGIKVYEQIGNIWIQEENIT
jgi:hypothetical protein